MYVFKSPACQRLGIEMAAWIWWEVILGVNCVPFVSRRMLKIKFWLSWIGSAAKCSALPSVAITAFLTNPSSLTTSAAANARDLDVILQAIRSNPLSARMSGCENCNELASNVTYHEICGLRKSNNATDDADLRYLYGLWYYRFQNEVLVSLQRHRCIFECPSTCFHQCFAHKFRIILKIVWRVL